MRMLGIGTAFLLLAAPAVAFAQSARSTREQRLVESVLVAARHAELAGRYREATELLAATRDVIGQGRGAERLTARLQSAIGLAQSEAAAYDGFSRDSTLRTLEHGLRLARSTRDPRALADALSGIGRIHYWRGFDDSSTTWEAPERYFASVDSIYRALGDSLGIAQSLFRLGLIHERREHRDSALVLFRAGEALAQRRGFDLELAYFSRHIGYYFEEVAKQVDSALVYQRRSLELREKVGFRVGQVFALVAIGDVLRGAGRREEAQASYREALRRAEQIGVKLPLEAARQALAR